MKAKFYGSGTVFQRGKRGTWYCRYFVNGRAFTERCLTEGRFPVTTETEARIFLRRKQNEAGAGVFIPPTVRNLRVRELFEALESNYKQNGRQLVDLDARWRLHLEPFFGGRKVEQVTHDALVAYRSKRLEEQAKPATINRELESLRRMFVLARQSGKIKDLPVFPQRLREDNVRAGFLEEKGFRAIVDGIQELWLRALLFTLYYVGDRRGELIPTRRHPDRGLRVGQVELHNRLIRLNTKTKTGRARTLPITFDMQTLLTACTFGKGPNDFVFTLANGRPVQEDDLRSAWMQLTRKLGLGSFVTQTFARDEKQQAWRRWKPSVLIHDFRRSAARNLIQHGVSQAVAMSITGHETDSVFRRYQIVSEADILEAGRKIGQAALSQRKSAEEPVAVVRERQN